ncbi:MAG: UDP-N-acetylglucosamine 2-epimerase, partial [Parafilimonas sp.]
LEGGNLTTMAKTTGLGVIELSNVFYNLKPDIVVVIADRFETLAVSIAAAYQNIPVAHIQGGEITGNIDEKVRHANTKLADVHLVSSENARVRVIRLGEDPDYVFNTGCPSIDLAAEVLQAPQLNFDVFEKYGGVGETFDFSHGYLVVMQHPVTTEYKDAAKQIQETLHAMYEMQMPVFWFWPNADAGADGMSHGIRAFREKYPLPFIHFFKNMRPEDFLKLLFNAKCLVGNSSAGIRECAFLGTPVVNIGSRQEGREKANNVADVNYDREQIKQAIHFWLYNARPDSSAIYGAGNAGVQIADVLQTVPLRYHKKINF